MVAPAFCGEQCEPGEALCAAHMTQHARPRSMPLPEARPIKTKPRRVVYY
jgi:hypothetical protein